MRNQFYLSFFCLETFSVNIDDLFLVKFNSNAVALQVGDILGKFVCTALCVGTDGSGHLEKIHLTYKIDIQNSVIRHGIGRGVETATVIPPVADTAECGFPGEGKISAGKRHVSCNPFEQFHYSGDNISPPAFAEGKRRVTVNIDAYSSVNTCRADTGGVSSVHSNQINFMRGALQQSGKIKIKIFLLSEHTAEIIARADRNRSDGDVVTLSLEMTPMVVEAADGQGKYVECGPLLFAFPVPATVTEDTNTYSNMNGKVPGDGFKCWSMKPRGDFNYALYTDAETLSLNTNEEKLANAYPFDLDGTPLSITLPVRPITWEVEKDRYNPVLPASEYVVFSGTRRNIKLVPYGATKLRVSVFPDGRRKGKKTLTDSLLINPDFELTSAGTVNHGGIEKKTYLPYGWSVQGTLNGNSYGINHDASNCYGENVCWWNTRPFPLDFQFYQTIPASKIKPGLYRIRCLLWCKQGDLGTCRLFANNNVQYFGKESDYDKNLTEGETATFAGHKGTSGATFILHEMEVTTSIEAGESLTLGIRTSCLKPDGTQATSSESTGWFKVDHFRIERIEGDGTGIGTIENGKLNIESSESPFNLQSSIFNNNVYNLAGQQVSKASNGIYIQNGKKFLTP